MIRERSRRLGSLSLPENRYSGSSQIMCADLIFVVWCFSKPIIKRPLVSNTILASSDVVGPDLVPVELVAKSLKLWIFVRAAPVRRPLKRGDE